MLKPVLLDTGVIVSLLDSSEHHHLACIEAIESCAAPLVTCEAVIGESCCLLRKQRGAAERILENVANGAFQIPFQLASGARQIQRILRRYHDREVDLADACLIHMASELRSGKS